MSTRGIAISAYIPAFAKGAQVVGANISAGVITSAHIADGTVVAADVGAGAVTSAKIGAAAVTSAKIGAAAVTSAKLGAKAVVASKMNAAQLTGAIISSGITYAVAHGLSAVPSIVVVGLRSTLALISGTASVGEASASARTSANIYLVGKPHGIGYAAYVQI